jgi:hypothetical protein
VCLSQDGSKLLLFTDSRIDDVRIDAQVTYAENQGYAEIYTVFASECLTPGDAIVIQASEGSTLTITYTSGGETIVETLST